MVARSPTEPHRVATPLELFFDLCFVVAVAFAGAQLHHALSAGRVAQAMVSYLGVFFAIWWAWMNFTWFASAYDSDDVPYRVLTMVEIAGALVLAAGVPRAFQHNDFTVVTIGYVIMRLALVTQWLRAARTDAPRRRTAMRFAVGVTLCQAGWVLRLALPDGSGVAALLVLVVAELAVPVWAERAARTTWHPHHIAERYGLFTLIVLGESVLAATTAMQSAFDGRRGGSLVTLAVGGLLIVFAMWWLYFAKPAYPFLTSNRVGFVWGYGHYFVFASAAAVGAGLQVGVDLAGHQANLSASAGGAAVSIPAAVFLLVLWFLTVRPHRIGPARSALYPVAAVLVLASAFSGQPVLVTGLVMAGLVAAMTVLMGRQRASVVSPLT